MPRLFSRSPAPQLIDKCPLTLCDGSDAVMLPTKPAILRLECSTPGTNWMPLQLTFPFYTQAFSLTQLVRPHPSSDTSCTAQTQEAKLSVLKKVKGVEK